MTIVNELQAKSLGGEFIGHKNRFGSLALGILAAAVAADSSVAAFEKQAASAEAELTSNYGSGDQVIIALPGCRTDGSYLAEMFEPQLEDVGDSHFISYPKRGFALDSIKEKLLKAREGNHDKPVSVLAISMGGMVLAEALKDPEFREKFGFIDRLVLDSSPSDDRDIRSQTRIAMGAAAMLRNSWTASNVGSLMMHRKAKRNMQHEECVSDQQVSEHFLRTNRTPLHLVNSQANFIRTTHFADNELAGTVGEIYYVQSPYDTVINTEQAADRYEKIYAADTIRVVDSTRPTGSHAAGPEFQKKIVDLLDLSTPDDDDVAMAYPAFELAFSAAA